MLRLEFKESPRARNWRASSLSMHPEALENMAESARRLAEQEGWHAWQIIDTGGRVARSSSSATEAARAPGAAPGRPIVTQGELLELAAWLALRATHGGPDLLQHARGRALESLGRALAAGALVAFDTYAIDAPRTIEALELEHAGRVAPEGAPGAPEGATTP